MSLRSTVRAFPTLLKMGVLEAVAYRAEMLIWVLSTTMPLVMLGLWSAVGREAPVGRYDQPAFVAYFLSAFIVRQLTGAWAAWEINYEVRQGTLAMRLLRPIHPLFHYAAENLGAVPMRVAVVIPVASLMLLSVGGDRLPSSPLLWAVLALSILGGWLITFLANVAIGTLSFFMESSLKITDLWFALFFVCSGYAIPLDLFPAQVREVLQWLPFRYQIGLPVELMTSAHGTADALRLLGQQWLYVGALGALALGMWRAGLKRFAAFGG